VNTHCDILEGALKPRYIGIVEETVRIIGLVVVAIGVWRFAPRVWVPVAGILVAIYLASFLRRRASS